MARSWRSIRQRRRRGEVPGQGTAAVSRGSLRGTLTEQTSGLNPNRTRWDRVDARRGASRSRSDTPILPPPYRLPRRTVQEFIRANGCHGQSRCGIRHGNQAVVRCGEGGAGRRTAGPTGNPGPSKIPSVWVPRLFGSRRGRPPGTGPAGRRCAAESAKMAVKFVLGVLLGRCLLKRTGQGDKASSHHPDSSRQKNTPDLEIDFSSPILCSLPGGRAFRSLMRWRVLSISRLPVSSNSARVFLFLVS